ncbi:MAG: hypothetical protein H7Y88_03030 [Phycisphaerales bacterium]|nr:hypothetical protein [Phycisphaerales bacterium]
MTFHVPPPRIIGEEAAAEELGPTNCSGCGRQLVFVIKAPRELAVSHA